MAELPPPPEGMVLTHFIVSDDVERSRRFYTEVLGGRVAFPGDPVNVALANGWIVINSGVLGHRRGRCPGLTGDLSVRWPARSTLDPRAAVPYV